MLPKWFNHNDIDWLRYYPMKDKKIYEYNSKRTLENQVLVLIIIFIMTKKLLYIKYLLNI